MNTQGVKSCHANSILIHVARVFSAIFGEMVILLTSNMWDIMITITDE